LDSRFFKLGPDLFSRVLQHSLKIRIYQSRLLRPCEVKKVCYEIRKQHRFIENCILSIASRARASLSILGVQQLDVSVDGGQRVLEFVCQSGCHLPQVRQALLQLHPLSKLHYFGNVRYQAKSSFEAMIRVGYGRYAEA